MATISIPDLDRAKQDVDHIADIATSLANTATDRLGHVKLTMQGASNAVAADVAAVDAAAAQAVIDFQTAIMTATTINNRGAWAPATAYIIKDLVLFSGTWYVCVVAHTSSAAFSTDAPTKWRVYQGVIAVDLAASGGAAMVGTNGPAANVQIDLDGLETAVSYGNKIINGDMRIDQRNGGAAAPDFGFPVDRWGPVQSVGGKLRLQQNAGAVTPPPPFTNYVGATCIAAYTTASGEALGIAQSFTGFNFSSLGYGTVNAKATRVTFWARSDRVGTHSGALSNLSNRSYPFTFNISVAGTWELKSIVIPGDTAGTWAKDSVLAAALRFNLGSGSSYLAPSGAWAATNSLGAQGSISIVSTLNSYLYITGVDLREDAGLRPFEFANYETELSRCQAYYSEVWDGMAQVINGTQLYLSVRLPQTMRVAPSLAVLQLGQTSMPNGVASAVSTVSVLQNNNSTPVLLLGVSTGTFTAGNASLYNNGRLAFNTET